MKTNNETNRDKGFKMLYKKSVTSEGYVGVILDTPGVISEGSTIDELKENLMDALLAMRESNRTAMKEYMGGGEVQEAFLEVA